MVVRMNEVDDQKAPRQVNDELREERKLQGKEVEVVRACDENTGALCRKEGDGN